MKGSAAISFARFMYFVMWVREQDRLFTAGQAAAETGNSLRTVYRYIRRMKTTDRIQSQAGVGYLYRRRAA